MKRFVRRLAQISIALVLPLAPIVSDQARATPSTSAASDVAAQFAQLVQSGVRAFREKRYDAAVRAFSAAYALRKEPELLYNVARSHEKALHIDDAIAGYEVFVMLPGSTAQLRTTALASLGALREEKAARGVSGSATRLDRSPEGSEGADTTLPNNGSGRSSESNAGVANATPNDLNGVEGVNGKIGSSSGGVSDGSGRGGPTLGQASDVDAARGLSPNAASSTSRPLGRASEATRPSSSEPNALGVTGAPRHDSVDHSLEWGLIGGGGVAVVLGAVFGVMALNERSAFENESTQRDDHRSASRRNALIADVLFGAGLLSAGAGTLLLLAFGDEGSDPKLSASVAISERITGVGLVGTF